MQNRSVNSYLAIVSVVSLISFQNVAIGICYDLWLMSTVLHTSDVY